MLTAPPTMTFGTAASRAAAALSSCSGMFMAVACRAAAALRSYRAAVAVAAGAVAAGADSPSNHGIWHGCVQGCCGTEQLQWGVSGSGRRNSNSRLGSPLWELTAIN